MTLQQFLSFLMALLTFLSGRTASVIGATDKKPLVTTQREYRFDRDRLLFGAYCFQVDGHFDEMRDWFQEAGLQFPVAVSGRELTND